MALKNVITSVKVELVYFLQTVTKKIATLVFNYPEVYGMPLDPPYDKRVEDIQDYLSGLPVHQTQFPPQAKPQKLADVFFGNMPHFEKIQRTYYYHKKEGYYNFHIPNYQNIYCLPDALSGWIQVHFNITVDVTPLVIIQQAVFIAIIGFYFLIEFRTKLYWFLTINPYTRPLIYLLSITDWITDTMAGYLPVTFGIDYTPTLLMGSLGKAADSLNHLIFTMPFLPSEGVPGILRDGNAPPKKVIIYKYLPILWKDHPIPNDLREFWYTSRPDILKFMKKYYGHLDIDFEPDKILKQIYDKQHAAKSLTQNIHHIEHLSTNLISHMSLHSNNSIEHFIVNSSDFYSQIVHKIIT